MIADLKKANPNMKQQDIIRRVNQLEKEKAYWAKEKEKQEKFIESISNNADERQAFDVKVLK